VNVRTDRSVRGIADERCSPGVRNKRPSLTRLPLCERHGLVWVIPTPTLVGTSEFDIDPWLGGLGPEPNSYSFANWSLFDRRVVPESRTGSCSSIPSMRVIISASCIAILSKRSCSET
jgi:hypothetical protein